MTESSPLAELPVVLRRTLAVALLVFAVTMVWQLVVAPLSGLWTFQDDWRTRVRITLARDRGWVESEPAWRSQEALVRQSPVWQRFISASAGVAPGASVQRRVTELLEGIAVPEVEVQATQIQDGLAAYPVRMRASLSIDQLKNLLLACHGPGMYLRVAHLTVSAPQSQLPQDNTRVQATLDLVGYSRRGPV